MTATTVSDSTAVWTERDHLAINTIRTLAMDAVEQAGCGHPGTPMALAPLVYVLFARHLKHDPADPHWPDRDRFVLSCGHASMLLYSILHLAGYDVTREDLQRFRQWGSRTPGHPELGVTPGVETTTGPLGQGIANAVGMALAEAHLAERFNRDGHRVVDHRTYVFASDGDLMEGVSHEACALAGHLRLGHLIVCYDANRITIDGSTDLSMSENVRGRFDAYGWEVAEVDDANDLDALHAAFVNARANRSAPSLIIVRSHIGYGSPNFQDSAKAHGAALGAEEVARTKANLGWTATEPFHVPAEVKAHLREHTAPRRGERDRWLERVESYGRAHPELAREFERRLAGRLAEGWARDLPVFAPSEPLATRKASSRTLQVLAERLPELLGGSADLAGSTGTELTGRNDIAAGAYAGRNIRFGVREHAMGSIANGLALHRGIRPFTGTFLIFSDYMRPALRLAALMGQPVTFVFSHDSIGLGEDGPTHQPIEHLASLRAIPNLVVLRPADSNETVEAWKVAIRRLEGPTVLVTTRQSLPTLDRTQLAAAAGVTRGAYVLAEAAEGAPRVILLASGSEVHLALQAKRLLEAAHIPTRVISFPSWELFRRQPREYRDQVLPAAVRARVALEAATPLGWSEWTGSEGIVVGISRFGASAPYARIYEEFGLSAAAVVDAARALV